MLQAAPELAHPFSTFCPDQNATLARSENDFSRVIDPTHPFFCFLHGPNCDLVEVEKAMFQGVDSHHVHIFCLLAGPNWDLERSRKRWFKGSTARRNQLLPSGRPKMWLARCRGSDVSNYLRSKGTDFCLLAGLKCDLGDVQKWLSQGVTWPWALIFCLDIGPKCDLGEVEKAVFLGSHSIANSVFLLAGPKRD
jgi:hypothetical protein